ncbi:MAG: hypothetical protein JXR75_03405 [Rhodobacteraceae bacterium]|nr:hypothetical protein [Paracoccaceae bacterium]
MARPPRFAPMFLQPASYRRRRRRDAARFLPVLGLFLILLPVLWAPQDTPRRDTAPDGIYLFGVWGLLIGAALMISRALAVPGEDDDPDPDSDPGADQDLRS